MFFKWGIQFFDLRAKEYGGFNHWIAKLFGYRYDYMLICFKWGIGYKKVYYDGWHHCLSLGIIALGWGN
jgi:hypothetical protein